MKQWPVELYAFHQNQDALQIVGDLGFIIKENSVSQLVDAMRQSIREMKIKKIGIEKDNSIVHIKKQYSMQKVDKYSKNLGNLKIY